MKLAFSNFLCFVVAIAALLPMFMASIALLGQQEQVYNSLTLGFTYTLLLSFLMTLWLMRKIRKPFNQFTDLVEQNKKLEQVAELRDEYLNEVQLLNLRLENLVDEKTAEIRATLSREESIRYLLKGLLDLSASLQRNDNIPLFVNSCLSGLSTLLLGTPVALYVTGDKTQFDSVGIDKKKSVQLLLQLKSYDRIRTQLPQKFVTSKDEYATFALSSRNGKYLGVLLIQCLAVDKERTAVFELFAKQISAVIETIRLTSELERLARTDELTHFFNRKAFNDSLAHAEQLYLRYPQRHIGLFVIDANGLKSVNDEYGHDAGDELICCLGHLLERTCRQSDQVFRLGGDEFAILVEDGTLQSCDCLMSRLAQEVGRHTLSVVVDGDKSVEISMNFSVGFASTESSEVDLLFKTADRRMYQQKQGFYAKAEKLC